MKIFGTSKLMDKWYICIIGVGIRRTPEFPTQIEKMFQKNCAIAGYISDRSKNEKYPKYLNITW